MKQPHIQFYTGDWLKDPALSICSPATRGIWIDLVCRLHEMQNGGKLSANILQVSRLCRCSEAEAELALRELASTDTGDISEENGVWTIVCRRMHKAYEISEKRRVSGSKGAAITSAKREQNPDIDIDNDGLLRVREFAREEGISESDADWFYWKGKGNGWTNGGKPMKDWKATLRSWTRAGYLPSQKNGSNGRVGRQMSSFEIKERIGAITQEINATFKKNGGRVEGDGIDELKKRRDDLQKQLLV